MLLPENTLLSKRISCIGSDQKVEANRGAGEGEDNPKTSREKKSGLFLVLGR